LRRVDLAVLEEDIDELGGRHEESKECGLVLVPLLVYYMS